MLLKIFCLCHNMMLVHRANWLIRCILVPATVIVVAIPYFVITNDFYFNLVFIFIFMMITTLNVTVCFNHYYFYYYYYYCSCYHLCCHLTNKVQYIKRVSFSQPNMLNSRSSSVNYSNEQSVCFSYWDC